MPTKKRAAVFEGFQGSHARIGQGIRRKRLEAGWSLAELAKLAGVAVSTMSKIENGKISTSFERLDAIGRALGADLAEFLQDELRPAKDDSAPAISHGTRRSVTRSGDGRHVDAGHYINIYHAVDILHKKSQPLVAEILIDNIKDYGPFTSHPGEEYNYILEGELEFHTKVYQPVVLKAGDSIYFDSEMEHAHIRVGAGPCRLLAVLMARQDNEPSEYAHPVVERRAADDRR